MDSFHGPSSAFLMNMRGGGSIYNGNTLITPSTKALEFFAICGTKDQGLTFLMVYNTLFYVSYLLRYRVLKQAHMYTLNTFHPQLKGMF